MSQYPIYIRLYRKRSPLILSDIAYLLKLSDYSNLSRYEKNERTPSMELLLAYHHLFNTSIESFYEPLSQAVLAMLTEQIKLLIDKLKNEETVPNVVSRVEFLKQALIRLTT